MQKLKETFGATKPKGEGDPYTLVEKKPPKSKRGINAPLPEEEKKKPSIRRRTAKGDESERVSIPSCCLTLLKAFSLVSSL
eukprot:31656-Eustigmatos_ZCMA.PRE.1